MYGIKGLRGGAVPIPSWILIFRAFQFFFALLTLALAAYGLSVYGGGPLQSPLIALIIISALTIVPILLLTTPLHMAQRRIYDPRIALLLDGFALLYWIAVFAALASYHRIFKYWGLENGFTDFEFDVCTRCRRAWRTGVAATVFAAIQFILFLITTLAFIYYYHCHLAEVPASGLGNKGLRNGAGSHGGNVTHNTPGVTPANTTTTTGAAGTSTAVGTGAPAESHPMGQVAPAAGVPGTNVGATHAGGPGTNPGVTHQGGPGPNAGVTHQAAPGTNVGTTHQGGYGGYQEGTNAGYGAERAAI